MRQSARQATAADHDLRDMPTQIFRVAHLEFSSSQNVNWELVSRPFSGAVSLILRSSTEFILDFGRIPSTPVSFDELQRDALKNSVATFLHKLSFPRVELRAQP